MTDKGVERLVGYQRAMFSASWKHNMSADELAEVYMAYAGAFEGFEDELVLSTYMKHARSWKKMPTIAEIFELVFAAQDRKAAGGRWRCVVCKKPWSGGEDFGRNQPRQPGELAKIPMRSAPDELIGRCPECNAILDRPVPAWVFLGGHELADDVEF